MAYLSNDEELREKEIRGKESETFETNKKIVLVVIISPVKYETQAQRCMIYHLSNAIMTTIYVGLGESVAIFFLI